MSHVVTIQTEVRDAVALGAACRRLNLSPPVHETTKLFSGEVTGLAVRLPGWRYPVVSQPEQGQLHFDNFNGRWGDRGELDRLLQAYAVEKVRFGDPYYAQNVIRRVMLSCLLCVVAIVEALGAGVLSNDRDINFWSDRGMS